MQRDLLKSRLETLHPDAVLPTHEDENDEEQEELDELPELGASSLPSASSRKRQRPSASYAPLSAEGLFAEALEVDVIVGQDALAPSTKQATNTFRTYYTPPTAVSNDRAAQLKSHGQVVFVCVHGAGYSGLSFARFAQHMAKSGSGVLAYDSRGHGRTVTRDGNDLSLETLSSDLVSLLKQFFPDRETAPSIVLVGHSMGGAVVAHACNVVQAKVATVAGVAVIDVVEGTALEALPKMKDIISSYPKSFDSVEDAIQWHVTSKTLNNLDSARVSVPSLVKAVDSTSDDKSTLVWRADLASTEPFWKGWFTGLSAKFLGCRTAKLLLLSGKEVLDKELMIGQMQGKFQLEVFPDVGHNIHQDAPERTADLMLSFYERNDKSNVLAGVRKVGQ